MWGWLKACALGVALSGAFVGTAEAQDCAFYAAPSGSNTNAGIAQAPFQTVEKLADALAPGQTGCLQGTFPGVQVIGDGGSPGAPITLRPSPGQTATLNALRIDTQNASLIPNSDIVLDGINIQRSDPGISLRVLADRVTLRSMDISHTGMGSVCVQLGGGADRARDVLIEGARIHACSTGDYAVTFESTDRAVMRDSYIFDNASLRAIQIYPDAQDTLIDRVIAQGSTSGEAAHFGGDTATHPNGTVIKRSILLAQKAVTTFWEPGQTGTSNDVRESCLSGTLAAEVGWTRDAATTILGDPGFFNAASHDFRMNPANACSGFGPQPAARTGDASGVTHQQAVIAGTATPRFQEANAWVEFGTTPALGQRTPSQPLGAGANPVPVTALLTGLAPDSQHFYRVVSQHSTGSGRTEGELRSFTTGPLPDGDGDGIPDVRDGCPVPRGSVDLNNDGCPDNSDTDALVDEVDACDLVPGGTVDIAPADGCPDNSDADPITDDADACDLIDGGPRDKNSDGCPDPYPVLSIARPIHKYKLGRLRRKLVRMTLTKLTIDAPEGATVRLRCRTGCAIDKRFVSKGKTLSLLSAFGKRKRVPLGATIEVRVVKPDHVGVWFRMKVDRKAGGFLFQQQCMPPNTLTPKAGACQ